jgi:hypothetical protein
MAYVPGFHYDVFVSYARRSDMASWVTLFKDDLERQLASNLGGRPALVWMDSQLQVGDEFSERIQSKLARTALLLAVVSPRYVESEACMAMELDFFRRSGSREVLQILKTPLEPEQRMPLPNLRYEKFFEAQDWGADEFEPGEPRFSRLVKQVSVQVRTRLMEMRRSRQKIYLTYLDPATTSATLRRHREELANEFEDRGYSTLPRQVMLNLKDDDDDFARLNVEQSDLLIYLPNGAVEAAQHRIAVSLRKPVVTCSLQPLAGLENDAELPVILGTTDWKAEVISRVEQKLTERRTATAT